MSAIINSFHKNKSRLRMARILSLSLALPLAFYFVAHSARTAAFQNGKSAVSPSVVLPPTISMTFNPNTVRLGQTSTLTITVTNPNPSTTLTGVAFTDNFPSGLVSHDLGGSCTGGLVGLTQLSIIDGTLPPNSSCTNFAIIETAAVSPGVITNVTTNITSDNGGNGGHASATLTVLPPLPPVVSKSFSPASIAVGQQSTLSVVLTNPNTNATLTGVNVSDTMPAGVILGSDIALDCSGTIDVSGNAFVISAVTLPANSICTLTTTVTGVTNGAKNNVTSLVNAGNAGNGNQASATLTVSCVNSFTVNDLSDVVDTKPGGSCPPTGGVCTLRGAIQAIQAETGCTGTMNINFNVSGTISLGSELPLIVTPMNFNGPGAELLTITGSNSFRLMNILLSTSGTMSINDLSFTGGRKSAGANAAALEFNNNGTLNVNRCEFYGNSGPSAGAADGSSVIFSNASAALNLTGSTIRNNTVEHVVEIGNTPFNFTNDTVSNNTGTGAGIFVFGGVPSATVTNSTIANNNTGIWHANGAGTSVVTIKNTLLSQNGNLNLRRTSGGCSATNNQIVSGGHNLIDDNSGPANLCALGPGDLAGTSVVAGIAPLAHYGGTTQTRTLLSTSQAINAGASSGAPTTDQRGEPRPFGGAVDIGAIEIGPIVNTTGDAADVTPGNGVCETATGNGICTLRAAIQEGQALGGNNVIQFNVPTPATISLGSSLPNITIPTTILGPGANLLTISGNNTFRHLLVLLSSSGPTSIVNINDLSFTGGRKSTGINAAALEFNNNGTMNVNRCEFFGNSGPSAGAADGSSVIFTNASTAMNLTGTTIRNNQVEHVVEIGNTPFNFINDTISNNTGTGAGIFIFGGVPSATITNSTLANNNQGIWHANGGGTSTVTIKNTLFSQNGNLNLRRTPGPCPGITNQIVSAGHNLIDDDSGPANLCTLGPGDLVGSSVVAGLTSIGNFGGSTPTRALINGVSQAINTGDNTSAPSTDQRGVVRPANGTVDIGAFEVAIDSTPTSLLAGVINVAYSMTLSGSGGTFPYSLAITSGSLPSGLTLSPGGVLSGTPTQSGGFILTVTTTDSAGIKGVRNYGLLINANSGPSIVAGDTFTRSQGSNSFSTVATVSDPQQSAGTLTVTATSVPSGISVSNISNTNGSILAKITASCSATLGDNVVTLTVKDSGNLTSTATFTVNVTANVAPSIAYNSNYTVAFGDTLDIVPPTLIDNGTINSTVILSHGTYTGGILADPSTGFIRLSNAAPGGIHTFQVRATDNCSVSTDASFTVTVTNPAPEIINYGPGSAAQNSSGTVVTIDGFNFTPDSVVLYNGASHATTFISNTQLSFALTAADTATAGVFPVAVMNPSPGGGTTDSVLFTIDPPNVCGSQTVDIPTLQFAHVMVMPGVCSPAGAEASMFHDENPGNTVSRLYVATYTGNPTGTSILDVGGGFMDLQDTNPGPIDVINAAFYYPASTTGATETNLKLFFFTGDHWQAVKSSGGSDPILDTEDNLNGTASGGMFSVGFDDTSAPKISELTSTVFTFSTVATPTAVDFDSATVTQVANSAVIEWRTGMEVNNLGFNVYRQSGGDRVKINPSLIAGTALMVGSNTRVESGYTYTWTDELVDPNASYWIEDVDLDGMTTWHGPFGVTGQSSGKSQTKSILLNNLNSVTGGNPTVREGAANSREWAVTERGSSVLAAGSLPVTKGRTPSRASVSASLQKQWEIASQTAVKIAINKTGWYKVNAADLFAAGLSASAGTSGLRMYVGGVEIPIKVNSADGVHLDSIEFYGVALDQATSDTQVYWLTSGMGTGKRIKVQQSPGSAANNGLSSFQYTVERKDRSLYFSSLRNGDTENWFGSVVATNPVTQTINIHNHDANAVGQAQLEIALQGVTTNTHQVTIKLNGQSLNTTTFDGMAHQVLKLSVPESSLVEGNNQITLSAQASGDVSLVDYIRVTYAHTFTADNNALSASVTGVQPVRIDGFTSNQIRAIDVVNANQPIELEGAIDGDAGSYSISVNGAKRRDLLVFTVDKTLQPLSITANQPASLSNAGNGADFVIITNKNFAASVQPLATLRESQGYQVSVVDIDSIYDEFSYGVHSPYAIRDFLNWTYTHWQKQPQFVMLAGSATIDPRNYTGAGFMDFVPTKLIDTSSMETASDDWFVDFNDDGKPQMSIGRLPVRTAADAALLVNKIIAYEHSDKTQAMVLVSDINDGIDFGSSNEQIRPLVPTNLNVVNINRSQTDAKATLLDQLNQGDRIVNYAGHGSVNLWRGGLLTDDDMTSLSNHKTSLLVVTMTCLNGYFQDPKLASLGESLLKVNQGGAVAVWASSGMTDAQSQTAMNKEFFRQLFGNPTITLGQAIKAAKTATVDNDIRRTWIFFGDPTMRIKQ